MSIDIDQWFSEYSERVQSIEPLYCWVTITPNCKVLFSAGLADGQAIYRALCPPGMINPITDQDLLKMARRSMFAAGAKVVARVVLNSPLVEFFAAPDALLVAQSPWTLSELKKKFPNQTLPVGSNNIGSYVRSTLSVPKLSSCNHDLKDYTGLKETYRYCSRCGKKESEIGRP